MVNKIGTFEDFKHFAKDKANVSGLIVDGVKNNIVTPYVLEERQLNVATYDIFSRMLLDRIIFLNGEVNQDSCNVLVAQLLYLSSIDDRDISMYISSPGGSVVDGLSVVDTMNFIKPDVSTTCIGMAASMGAVILSNGTKGKRFILPHGRVMIHSVSSGFHGHTADIKIEMEQTLRCQDDLYKILSANCDKPYDEIERLCDRDRWYIGKEAVEDLGIVDSVLEKK